MSVTVGRIALADINLIFALGADNQYAFRYSVKGEDDELDPVDLTGYAARSQIRGGQGRMILDLTRFITLGGVDGTINIAVPAADSENLRACGPAIWDLELTDADGGVVRFAQGNVGVSQDVTR